MKRSSALAALAFLPIGLLACSASPVEVTDSEPESESSDEAYSNSDNFTFYRVTRQDLRRCAFPMCGGVYVSRVNRATTQCADGKYAAECYVAVIDTDLLGLIPSEARKVADEARSGSVILRGKIANETLEGTQLMASTLHATEGWAPSGAPTRTSGNFYRVVDNGIRCVKAPCANLSEGKLNNTTTRSILNVDLTDAHLNSKQEQLFSTELANKNGALVLGWNVYGKSGTSLDANAVYFKVKPTTPGYCVADEDCVLTTYTKAVKDASDCYCRLCGGATDSVTAESNAASYQNLCSDFSKPCPMPYCLPLRAACVQGQCSALHEMPQ